MKYICPICGFDELEKVPYDENGNDMMGKHLKVTGKSGLVKAQNGFYN